MRLSYLLRKAKQKYTSRYKNDVKAINRFVAFFLKEYANEIFVVDNRNSNQYIRGIIHGFILFIILYFLFVR